MQIVSSPDAFLAQRVGGVSRYFSELFVRLPGLGVQVRMPPGVHRNMLTPADVALRRLPDRLDQRRVVSVLGRANALSTAVARPRHSDLYHPSYYSAPLRAMAGLPRVVTVFDMAHERIPALARADPIVEAKRQWCAAADVILAISAETKKDVIECYGVDESRVVVTPLAPSALSRGGGVIGSVPPRPFVLVVGARWAHKDFRTAIHAISRVGSSGEVVAVLFGSSELSADDRRHVDDAGMADRIVVLSGDDRLLDQLYRRATCLLYPSTYEGFGLPLLEAMARRCPVVCSDIPVHREVAGDGALFFEAGSLEGATDALQRVAESASLRNNMADRGERNASRFSWDATAALTVAAYRSLTDP